MTRLLPMFIALALFAPLSACKKAETTSPDQGTSEAPAEANFEGREVVDNWKAQVGDVTVCPISGKKFEVSEESGHYEHEGHDFVFCCAGECLDKVAAEPDKYLGELVSQAKAEAGEPEPADALSPDAPEPAPAPAPE